MKKTDLYLKPGTYINVSTTTGEVSGISLEKFVIGVLTNPTCCPKPVFAKDGMLMTASFLNSTLQTVTDQNLNSSPLKLSTTSVTSYGGGNIATNTAFGDSALFSNTTAVNNTAFGFSALYYTSTGNQNTAFGTNAASYNTTGYANTAMGWQSLLFNQTGIENVAIGNRANYGTSGQSASRNVAVGNLALLFNYGSSNVAIGNEALRFNTTGINNSALGANTASGNFSGSVILGREATATADNQFVVGSASVNAGAIDTAAVTPTQRWKVRINGVDYYIALQPV